jgi:hypothetical protein
MWYGDGEGRGERALLIRKCILKYHVAKEIKEYKSGKMMTCLSI